jgi:pimeloyl-ACP methyl ester carboxylesterase
MAAMRLLLASIGALCCLLVATAPAAAVDKVVTVPSDGPGPKAYDHVYVHQMGPRGADRVLVLMPGTSGGAGDFTQVAQDLLDRVADLQVWALDRRSQALEDTAVFEQQLAGEKSLQEMFDYYLGWATNGGTPADHFQFLDADTVPFAREWGMRTAIDDARRVVLAARKGHDEVFLGGHSLGASLTAAYAAWDFRGKPGYRDVDGLVLIDGGLLGSFTGYDLGEAKQALDELEQGDPFADVFGTGLPPESAGLFGEVGAQYALRQPTERSPLQDSALLPAAFKPSVSVTNRALFGFAFDRDTSPFGPSLQVNAGELAGAGDPRDWVDGGVTPVERLAANFGLEPNGVEWYFPRRLTIDTNGADQMKRNAVARFLGLRLEHTDEIDVPIYAFQTDLTHGGVLRGARNLVKRAATSKRDAMLVNGAPLQSHLDPLTAAPQQNEFLKTLVEFLDRN